MGTAIQTVPGTNMYVLEYDNNKKRTDQQVDGGGEEVSYMSKGFEIVG